VLRLGKKQVKIVSLTVAIFFMLGVIGIALSQSGSSVVSAASSSSGIGVVNYQMLFAQHPDTAKAQETIKVEYEQAKTDFDTKSATMNDQQKQEYSAQLQQRLSLRDQELSSAVREKIDAVVKSVADAKGLSVIMDKGTVVYGGVDITEEVGKKITGK